MADSGLDPRALGISNFGSQFLPLEICDLRCRGAALLLRARPSITLQVSICTAESGLKQISFRITMLLLIDSILALNLERLNFERWIERLGRTDPFVHINLPAFGLRQIQRVPFRIAESDFGVGSGRWARRDVQHFAQFG